MAGGKVSPRQKMINMMYLVLTALLALNVSKEILKAFYLVEVSFDKTGQSIDKKNANLLAVLKQEEQEKGKEITPFREKAEKVAAIAKTFIDKVEAMKKELEVGTGGRKPDESGDGKGELMGPDNIEKHANFFMLQGKGKELQDLINKTNADMLAFLEPKDREVINKNFTAIDDPKKAPQTWYSEYFEHSPLAGVMAILTKIQNDCRTTEAEVLEQVTKDINKKKIVFDKVIPIVRSEQGAIMVGGTYKADIILGAYNSQTDNEVVVNGRKLESKEGKAQFETRADREGEFSYKGTINVMGPSGAVPEPFEIKFQAFQAAATISATAMNVFYAALDNPVSISVPGANPKDVNASLEGPGTLTRKPGSNTEYIYRIASLSNVRKVNIKVSVKLPDGTTKAFPPKEYRLKIVPTPETRFGGLISGAYSPAQIKAQTSILAFMEGFVFEGVNFTVTQYEIVYIPKRGEFVSEKVMGNQIRGNIVSKIRAGDKILVQGVRASGPNGLQKFLGPVAIDVK